jgi:hypothetical protein
MTEQLMDDLTNEEHETLLLMSEHGIAAPLSPAAQAVHDAFWSHPNGKPLVQDCPDTDQLVAALRAVVQELKYFGITEKNVLAIADELEAQ